MFKQYSKLNEEPKYGIGAYLRQRGVTLVESAMVISIISLVIMGSLLALEAVTEQRRMTQAVQDIAMIRSAVSKFAAGGLVVYPPTGPADALVANTRNLGGWDDLAGFLPGSLGIQAASDTDLTIATGNPWSEDYEITLPPTTSAGTGSARWTLTLNGIPSNLAPVLIKQLALNGASGTGSATTTSCNPADTGDVATGVTWICVSYEE